MTQPNLVPVDPILPAAAYVGGKSRLAATLIDYSRDVANFFRILQRHFSPFVEMLRYQITSRAENPTGKPDRPGVLRLCSTSTRRITASRITAG